MRNRIHSCLDGGTVPGALAADERLQAARLAAVIEAVAGELLAVPAPDLTDGVMDATAAWSEPCALEPALA